MATYELIEAPATLAGLALRCLKCGCVSYHALDVYERKCGYCHTFHVRSPEAEAAAPPDARATAGAA